MITLSEIRKKTRKLTATVFGNERFDFEHRICTLDAEGEKVARKIAEADAKAEPVRKDESLTELEKFERIEELGADLRSQLRDQLLVQVASWEVRALPDDKACIPVTREALDAADVPLEIYFAVFKAISDTPLVPNLT